MRYLTLAEALAIAEAVTGIDAHVLARTTRINLLDSALHAPQASFGGADMYSEFLDQAAVPQYASLGIIRSWTETSVWRGAAPPCSASLNDHKLHVPTEEAVTAMLSVAAGHMDEAGLAQWLAVWVDRNI